MRPSRPVILVALATAFSLLGDQTLYAVLPTYYTDLGLMPYQVGLILSVNRWIRLFTNHLAERLCRRYSLTLLLSLSLILGAALTVVYGSVSLFSVLFAARLLWGLCWSFIRQVGLLTVADSAPEGRIGRMMGFYNGTSRLGSLAGNLGGAVGHDLIGFTLTLLIFGVLSLLAVPLGILSRWKLPHVDRTLLRADGLSWRDSGLLTCGFVVGCVGAGLMMSTLGLVLRETVGDSLTVGGMAVGVATLNGMLLAGRWVTDGLGAPFLGALGDRIGRRQGALLFFGVGTLAMLTAAWVSGTVPLVLSVLLFFACGVGATVVMVSEASMRGPRTLASYVTAADMGSAVGPILGWTMQQAHFSTDWIFLLGGGLYALAVLTSLRTFEGAERGVGT